MGEAKVGTLNKGGGGLKRQGKKKTELCSMDTHQGTEEAIKGGNGSHNAKQWKGNR